MGEPCTVPEPVSLLASGHTHEYNPFCAHKSPQLLSEMQRSLRGADIKHDRNDKRNYTVLTSAREIRGCAAAEDSVQFMTYLWHKYILFMARMALFIYDLYSLLE